MEIAYFVVTTVDFISSIAFYSVATRSFGLQNCLRLAFSVQKVNLILLDLSIRCSFSQLSTYGKSVIILIYSSWVSVTCVYCCD